MSLSRSNSTMSPLHEYNPSMVHRGDIILINFEGAGHEQSGVRPALCISKDEINACGMCVVMPITRTSSGPHRYELPRACTDKYGTRGCVLTMHIRTLDYRHRQCSLVGRLEDPYLGEVLDIARQGLTM